MDSLTSFLILSSLSLLAQDWVEDMKNELEKNPVDRNNIVKLYKRMYSALGDLQAKGLGPFRRKFIQVWLNTVALMVAAAFTFDWVFTAVCC